MKDQKQCANCGKQLSATQSCDCVQSDAKQAVLKDKAHDTPSITTGQATTEYEFSSPIEYGGGTGEYAFGIMQDKKTGEHVRDLILDDADEDDLGSTLLMDKPNIKKTIAPESAVLPERVTPAVAIKNKPKPNSSTMHPLLFIVCVVLFITFVGVIFFCFVTVRQYFRDPAIVVSETMPEETAEIPALSKPILKIAPSTLPPGSSSEKVVYALGHSPFTAAPQGGLKSKSSVVLFDGFSDDKIRALEEQNCAEVSLEGAKVRDHDLQHLSKLKNIYMLDLQNSYGYSPKGLFVFKGTTLKRLHLDGTGISDKWIPVLAALPLEYLSVMGNKLSDESLATLAKSKTLKFLKFETRDSNKIKDTFNSGGWMRRPEGNERAFNYYRDRVNPEAN